MFDMFENMPICFKLLKLGMGQGSLMGHRVQGNSAAAIFIKEAKEVLLV